MADILQVNTELPADFTPTAPSGLTDEEAYAEASRCLRCDHFGFGAFRGGRIEQW